jgi:hypothetical protein
MKGAHCITNVQSIYPKLLAVPLALAVLLGATRLPARAEALTPPAPIAPTGDLLIVSDAPGGQTDPHISGPWVSYTDNASASIRVQNVNVAGSDRVIAHPAGSYDNLSNISGGQVVWARAWSSGYQGIYTAQIDTTGKAGEAQEVLPVDGAVRRRAAVGGGVIAFEDRSYSVASDAQPEITLFDPAAPSEPVRLTTDEMVDQVPAVSPDGSTVVWVKCASATACGVWQATRSAGGWTSMQLTGDLGTESLPDTDGTYVVYGSIEGGDDNIVYQPVGGGAATTLALPGVQRNANISDGVILFESSATPGAQFDLFAYDLATELLYQVTDTRVSEWLSDISVGADGVIHVVWGQLKLAYPYDTDVYAFHFERQYPQPQPALTVQALFDQGKAHRVGNVVPIRFQLLDANGANVSSAGLSVTAAGLEHQDDTSVTAVVDDVGNSSADSTFRYDEALQGYIYNLSTRGLAAGTWALHFGVGGDTHPYTIAFDLR